MAGIRAKGLSPATLSYKPSMARHERTVNPAAALVVSPIRTTGLRAPCVCVRRGRARLSGNALATEECKFESNTTECTVVWWPWNQKPEAEQVYVDLAPLFVPVEQCVNTTVRWACSYRQLPGQLSTALTVSV